MPQVLRVKNLFKTFGHGDIFRDVNFTLDSGETLGIFGMSGSGKSTLGRCIIGLDMHYRGEVEFNGKNLKTLSKKEYGPERTLMQMIFQHPEMSFDPKMRVIDSVTEPVCYHFKKEKKEVFQNLQPLIKAVALRPEQFYSYPAQLSGGEIQRAMMVKIYSLSPKLIIADEPTSMLDMSVQAQVLNLMKSLQKENKTACIFISHDPEVMMIMCDRIAVLDKGTFKEMRREEFKDYSDKFSEKFTL
ncbi:peptide/nickel transport system ATP-binding protein [Methanomicrobium sp. W14]|uniref:ABC transporter ATP-binding protein n=1 Tax=Methanomicrobium sp. W14 TaxID=2817839 RepID=UPI001AE75594|nr:dipeptide/oligopeptide/nickel ABC transporter ATP-binding protein [Methanomicrobium sp. W14]MBP2132209.1 peptide/nickel transport system ATP-binding protein [Methanomicrobium sp. W14]